MGGTILPSFILAAPVEEPIIPELTLEWLAGRLSALERTASRFLPMNRDPAGTVGDEQSNDPDAIALWLAEFDAIPAATMTIEEESAWQAARLAQKHADDKAFDRFVADLPGSQT